MGDHDDTAVTGLFQNRFDGFDRERHDVDGINALCDQVFNQLHLCGSVRGTRSDHPGIVTGVCAELFDTFAHTVKPCDTVNLDHGGDGIFLAGGFGCEFRNDVRRFDRFVCMGRTCKQGTGDDKR